MLPFDTIGITDASTMMIAEKAADIILGNDPLPADHTPVFRRDIEPA